MNCINATVLSGPHSGSPVVDQFGEVLGVVIGGFGLGEFGTSWAIPLSEINTVPVSDNALQELSRLRGQFSDSIAAPIKIARLHLLCGSEGDDVKSPFDLSTSEATQVRDFRDILEENKDGLIYAEVTLEQNSCMACD